MNNKSRLAILVLIAVGLGSTSTLTAQNRSFNRIEGTVVDKNRTPVPDAFVELSNWVGGFLGRTKTSGAGRFTFSGVSSGRFLIKVLPLGKNLLQQEQDVEVSNQNARSETVFVEFVLPPDTRGQTDVPSRAGTIFVQEIPAQAKALCESGARQLDEAPDKGIEELEKAIVLYPEYFDARYFLGVAYSNRKDYEKAYAHLLKAVDVNPKSAHAFYLLGFAFYQLKQYPAAILATKAVVNLNPASTEGYLLQGSAMRLNGDLLEAEAALRKAKSIDKNKTAEISWQLALVLNKSGRNPEAAAELEAYLRMAPDSPEKKKIKELIDKLKTAKK